jgi:flagellar biosynthetic protein FliQ
VNPDQTVALLTAFLRTVLYAAGPVLAVALAAGVIVGILQTATQVNEASISFLVKVGAIVLVIVILGPQLASYVTDYARTCLRSVADVVR